MSVEDQISNYYEHKVVNEIYRQTDNMAVDAMADIACVALNRLPVKYFRYEVDLAFYLSAEESARMEANVKAAVKEAIEFVKHHRRSGDGPS